MAIADVKEYTHLTEEEVEQIGRELDAIRQEIEDSRGDDDAAYINRLIKVQRGLAAAARVTLMFSNSTFLTNTRLQRDVNTSKPTPESRRSRRPRHCYRRARSRDCHIREREHRISPSTMSVSTAIVGSVSHVNRGQWYFSNSICLSFRSSLFVEPH